MDRDWPIRVPRDADIPSLAAIWHQGWHEAHAAHMPPALVAVRTKDDFERRLPALRPATRTAGPPAQPLGMCTTRGDELHQMFVAPGARGTGLAARLIADGEARLAANGVTRAWLGCVIGNTRAARFYEKSGWQRTGTMNDPVDLATGRLDLTIWRYEKTLCVPSQGGPRPTAERTQ